MRKKSLYLFLLLSIVGGARMNAQNWVKVWEDTFDTAVGPDWVFEIGNNNGWGNNELQYYRSENASVVNGNLVITAKKEAFGGKQYTSVRMKTQGKKSWKYGKIEASIAMPNFTGAWPAFWMLGDNISTVGWPKCGEIDIMEHANSNTFVQSTCHWYSSSANTNVNYGQSSTGTTNVTTFHKYTVIWTSTLIKSYIDDVLYYTISTTPADLANAFNGNFFVLLNFAIGGNFTGNPTPTATAFPAEMKVDYVRVFQDLPVAGTDSFDATAANNAVEIAPNPVNQELSVTSQLDLTGGYISIADVTGKQIIKQTNNLQSVNVSLLAPGLYIFTAVTQDGHSISKKFVKDITALVVRV